MKSVPKRRPSRGATSATTRKPLLSDYLSDAEMERLAEILVNLHLASVRNLRDQGLTDAEIRARFKGYRARRNAEGER